MGENTNKGEQQHEQQLNGHSSKGGIRAYLAHRAKPYLPPWLGMVGVGVVSAPATLLWEGDTGAAVLLTLSSVGLTGATWAIGKTTSQARRLHSAITVAAGSSWLTAATLAGPLTGPVPTLYFTGGAALALSWNIRQIMRRSPDGAPVQSDADKGVRKALEAARAKITGAPTVEPNRLTLPYAIEAGEGTNEDMGKALGSLAGALDVPATAVRNRPDPDSAGRGEVVIVPTDMLVDAIKWHEGGPTSPGASIADPLILGVYDDGQALMMWLPGDRAAGRNATHLLIAGMTGSGKGDGALNLLTEVLSRRDVIVWFSDPKEFQDFRPLVPAMDWAVTSGAPTEGMVEAVKAAIPDRTRWLGAHRYRQWEPAAAEQQNTAEHTCREDGSACGCPGLPFLVAWFEEAGVSLSVLGDDAFNDIANLARSAGVGLVVSLQRPSHDQISTTTRDALGARLCFGVPNATAAGFMLPDPVTDAGARPESWANRRPGYCYLVTPGVDEARYSSPARTRWFTDEATSLMEAVAHWAVRNGAKADPVTAGAAARVVGKAYTERSAGSADTHTAAAPAAGEDSDVTDGPLLDPEDTTIDPERDLPDSEPGDETPLVPPTKKGKSLSSTEARELLDQALRDFENHGVMVIGPKDLYDWCARHDYDRTWVSKELKALAMKGRLADTGKVGRWRIVPAAQVLTPA
ncbi:plasmid transfer protein TraB [Streptomyces noursei]